MNLATAETIARKEMDSHNLHAWDFKFDEAKRRYGLTTYSTMTISMSRHLTQLNDERQFRDTLLHEIAHALVGSGNGHNRKWQYQARQIGCTGYRTYGSEVTKPKAKWRATCPHCKKVTQRFRKTKDVACGQCCNKYNGGYWSSKFLLDYKHL